jgi:hypothetical protein
MNNKDIWTLCVRRWFDKTHGNSYYTMRIVPPRPYSVLSYHDSVWDKIVHDQGEDFIVTMTYGHGYATYVERARQFAEAYNYHTTDVRYIVDETQVMRRKDLHNNGK